MTFNEEELKKSLKQETPMNVYFIYGEESFLVKTYTDRIINAYLTESERDFNLIKFSENINMEQLSDAVETLPIFASYKIVLISDVDYDKLDNDSIKILLGIIDNPPPDTILLMSSKTVILDDKKAKVKKVITTAGKIGAVCKFDYLKPPKIAGLIIKKAAKNGVAISKENAVRIAELTLCDMTLIGTETDKLCAYAGAGGTITREIIDALVSKQLDAGIYDLANAMTGGNRQQAFNLLDELNAEGFAPEIIMYALSGAFVDYYRAFVGGRAGGTQAEIAKAYDYPGNRTWAIGKALSASRRVGIERIRKALNVLYKSDIKLKSSPVNNEIILQQALAEIMEGI